MNAALATSVTGSDLRLRRFSLLVWVIAVALLVVMIVGVYPSVRGNPSLNAIYGNLSTTAQALLGGSDLTSPVGYLSTQLFAFFLPAVLLVFAIGRGAAAVAGDEEDGTLDLLLAQPLSRRSLYLQKAAAVTIGVLVLVAASWLPLVSLQGPSRLDIGAANTAAACVQMGLFCLALALIADAVAAATGRRAVGVAVSAGYAVVSYVVYGLTTTVHPLRRLRPFTLWRWYLGNDPLRTGFGTKEVLVMLAVCAVAVAAGVMALARRDLHG